MSNYKNYVRALINKTALVWQIKWDEINIKFINHIDDNKNTISHSTDKEYGDGQNKCQTVK